MIKGSDRVVNTTTAFLLLLSSMNKWRMLAFSVCLPKRLEKWRHSKHTLFSLLWLYKQYSKSTYERCSLFTVRESRFGMKRGTMGSKHNKTCQESETLWSLEGSFKETSVLVYILQRRIMHSEFFRVAHIRILVSFNLGMMVSRYWTQKALIERKSGSTSKQPEKRNVKQQQQTSERRRHCKLSTFFR